MFSIYRTPICFLALLLLSAVAAGAKTINDSKYGFALEIPDDFVGNAQLATADANSICAFRRPGTTGDTCLVIERMHGMLGPQRLKASNIPANINADVYTTPWKGLDIDCAQVVQNVRGIQLATFVAQIPLKDEAIQICLSGPVGQTTDNRALLGQMVASLEGDSNLLDPDYIAKQAPSARTHPC